MVTKVKARWIGGAWVPVDDAGSPLANYSNFNFKDEKAAKDKTKEQEGEIN